MDHGRRSAALLEKLPAKLLPALALLLTLPSLAHAYSINTTETGRRIRWSRAEVTLHVEPGLLSMLPNDEVVQALHMGVDAWQGLPGTPQLTLSGERPPAPGHHKGGPRNGVYLPPTWEHDTI
jgi:hypothetical protein